jgi:hypothetical protein
MNAGSVYYTTPAENLQGICKPETNPILLLLEDV